MKKLSLQLNGSIKKIMASRYTSCISYGSDETAKKRKQLYKQGAERIGDGNLSRLIMILLDKKLGIDLPLPSLGRPRKVKK